MSQRVTLSESEFDDILGTAVSISTKKSRRIRATEETRSAGRLTGTNYYIEEFQMPDRFRFIDTISSSGKSATSEIIEIGDKGYSRDDGAVWIQWERRPVRRREPKLLPSFSSRPSVFYRVNDEENGLSLERLVCERSDGDLNGIDYREVYKIWVSPDKLIVKTEHLQIEKIADKWVNRTIALWEYKPEIEINIPVKKL